jgi:hypothetical protein
MMGAPAASDSGGRTRPEQPAQYRYRVRQQPPPQLRAIAAGGPDFFSGGGLAQDCA